MKQTLLTLLIVGILLLTSAVVPMVTTVKPAKPKVVRHQTFKYDDQANDYITKCVQDGYIIKSVAATGGDQFSHWIVVAEKY